MQPLPGTIPAQRRSRASSRPWARNRINFSLTAIIICSGRNCSRRRNRRGCCCPTRVSQPWRPAARTPRSLTRSRRPPTSAQRQRSRWTRARDLLPTQRTVLLCPRNPVVAVLCLRCQLKPSLLWTRACSPCQAPARRRAIPWARLRSPRTATPDSSLRTGRRRRQPVLTCRRTRGSGGSSLQVRLSTHLACLLICHSEGRALRMMPHQRRNSGRRSSSPLSRQTGHGRRGRCSAWQPSSPDRRRGRRRRGFRRSRSACRCTGRHPRSSRRWADSRHISARSSTVRSSSLRRSRRGCSLLRRSSRWRRRWAQETQTHAVCESPLQHF